jgi:hypothetical protein
MAESDCCLSAGFGRSYRFPSNHMPIRGIVADGYIHSILEGHLTDDELLSYYKLPMFESVQAPWLEIVDGRLVTEMGVTANGQRRLGMLAESRGEMLRGGRVAMVAGDDLCFGMFRMWEMSRPELDYELRVFRDFDEGKTWIKPGSPEKPGHPDFGFSPSL